MPTLAYWLAYSVVQLIFQLPQLLFRLVKSLIEVRRVARMSPEELQQWREREIARLHEEAVRQANRMRDKDLVKRGLTRADYARRLEVRMRGDRGRELSQSLLDGMDVRGLDLSKVKPGAISQHIDRAMGDRYTRLPAGLKAPKAWSARDTSRGQPDSDLGRPIGSVSAPAGPAAQSR
jgi:hypothetical protein